MPVRLDKFIGSKGTVLIPLNQNETNTAPLISTKGEYFIPFTTVTAGGGSVKPVGLLLAITYPRP